MTVDTELLESSSASASASDSFLPLLARLLQSLSSSSKAIESGDDSAVLELVNFLNSMAETAVSDPENDEALNNAFQSLSEIHKFLLCPSLDQVVIDALPFELTKPVSRISGLSDKCVAIADGIIDRFIAMCGPRDMISVLCEALDAPRNTINAAGYAAPILSGLSKVLHSIKRRQFEHVKEAVPIILNVLKAVSREMDESGGDCILLFDRALGIADSIHALCSKMEGSIDEKLRALLGLYILQIMSLLSVSMGHEFSMCIPLVSRMSRFFSYCGLSYLGLITGSDLDKMTNIVVEEQEDDFRDSFTLNKLGASLSVIWGHVSDEVTQSARENMSVLRDELRSNQTTRWQALAMLKLILSSISVPWKLKEHAIDFLVCITNGDVARNYNDEHSDCSIYMPGLCALLQATAMVIMYSPTTLLRKKSFEALKMVLSDCPTSQKLSIFQTLITNSSSSSMTAILLDLFRGELHMENCQRTSMEKDEVPQADNQKCSNRPLWTPAVLELLELVLRPPKGGPPSFPEDSEAVLAALNLYRFILLTESAGKTNFTEVLAKNNLQRAYNEWLLPLRTLVSGIKAENEDHDSDQHVIDAVCALNPVELVLYRCIELVEEKLKASK